MLDVVSGEVSRADKLLVELTMTAYAVGIYDSLSFWYGLHALGFCAHRKNRRVSDTILRFEQVFGKDARVWYVTVDTRGIIGMRAMLPSRIVGPHDVTIDTHLGAVTQIAISLGYIYEICRQPHKRPSQCPCNDLHPKSREEPYDGFVPEGTQFFHNELSLRRGYSLFASSRSCCILERQINRLSSNNLVQR